MVGHSARLSAARRRAARVCGPLLCLALGAVLLLRWQPRAVAAAPAVYRIMPLGDSLTEGNYPGQIHSYRGYLRARLLTSGYTREMLDNIPPGKIDGFLQKPFTIRQVQSQVTEMLSIGRIRSELRLR